MELIEGGHVVTMIPIGDEFKIHDGNETQSHAIDHFPYRHNDIFRPIDQITYVFAPSGIIPGQVQTTKRQKLGA